MKPYLIAAIALSLLSCGEGVPQHDKPNELSGLDSITPTKVIGKVLPTKIVLTDKHETPNEAQLLLYAIIKPQKTSKEDVTATLMEIYGAAKDYDNFAEHERPTTIGVYLYFSEKDAVEKSAWVGMLDMTPDRSAPEISIDEDGRWSPGLDGPKMD